MTFEEMQKIIEGMLAVQRQLQERPIKFEQSQEAQKDVLGELIQRYGNLAEDSIRQKEILDRLIGYSLTNETDHLNLQEKLQALEARMKRIESQN